MWYIGVAITSVACFLGALGDNLVRLSFVKEQAKAIGSKRPLYGRPLWLAGMFCSVGLNAVLTIISLNFASAAIITPFAGLHIFWNVILARYVIQEKVLAQHVIGSLMVLFGLTLVLIFGIHDNPDYGLETLLQMYNQSSFIVYSIFCSGLLGFCLYAGCSPTDARERSPAEYHMKAVSSPEDAFSVTSERSESTDAHSNELEGSHTYGRSGSEDSLGDEDCVAADVRRSDGSKLHIWRRIKDPRLPSGLRRFAVAATSGICGGNTNVMVQNIMKVFNTDGYAALSNWQFVIVCIVLGFLATGQLFFLNAALAQYEAIYVVPMLNSMLIATGCIAGLALDPSAAHMPPFALTLFSIGTIGIIWGIFVLSRADARRNLESSESEKLHEEVFRSNDLELAADSGEDIPGSGPEPEASSKLSTFTKPQAALIGAPSLPSPERSGPALAGSKAQKAMTYVSKKAGPGVSDRRATKASGAKPKRREYQPLSDTESGSSEDLDESTFDTLRRYREEAAREVGESELTDVRDSDESPVDAP